MQDGVEALNMRLIAKNLNISVGSLYNYFINKDEILVALIQENWMKAFQQIKEIQKPSFFEELQEIYDLLSDTMDDETGYMMKSLSSHEENRHMSMMVKAFEDDLVNRMKKDSKVVIEEKEELASFIVFNVMELLKKQEDATFFFKLLKKVIY